MSVSESSRNVSRESVAAEVRAHLARARKSGRAAALELGWTQPYMSRRLNGDIAFDVDDLAALAELLGVPVIAFFQSPYVMAQAPRGQQLVQMIPVGDLHRWAAAA